MSVTDGRTTHDGNSANEVRVLAVNPQFPISNFQCAAGKLCEPCACVCLAFVIPRWHSYCPGFYSHTVSVV